MTLAASPENQSLLSLSLPPPMERIESAQALTQLILRHTGPGERILVQTRLKADPQVFALWWNREVAGCTYPVVTDPLHFDRERMLGRAIRHWKPGELKIAIDLWGITKVVAWSPEAMAILESALGPGGRGGTPQIYTVPNAASLLLTGSGDVRVSVNRIKLTNLRSQDGVVVIRYRFHPAWQAEPPIKVLRRTYPRESHRLHRAAKPADRVTLRFDPRLVFRAPFFESAAAGASAPDL